MDPLTQPQAATPAATQPPDLSKELDAIKSEISTLTGAVLELSDEIKKMTAPLPPVVQVSAPVAQPDPFAFLAELAKDYVAVRAATAKK